MRGRFGASIAWGYHTAARLSAWEISKNEKGVLSLAGTCSEADALKCKQPDLLLAIPRKGGFWIFPVRSLTLAGRQVAATLGPIEH